MMALTEASKVLNGTLQGENRSFSNVSTDTRHIQAGDLYVALHGENFDGHDYIEQAKQAGAVAAVVEKNTTSSLPLIKVENTRKALGELAAEKRRNFTGKLVAVTGSNGKTTVKEMLTAITEKQGTVLATQGNFNNDIGLPLTLLRMQQEDFAIIEMGANHHGEILNLTSIARPDVALINNAAQSHLEGFGSVKGVAEAKGEIYQGLNETGTAVINLDDAFSSYWLELAKDKKCVTFSMLKKDADVFGEWKHTETGGELSVKVDEKTFTVNLNVFGLHNGMNALAAVAVSRELGISNKNIQAGLSCFSAVKGRLNFHKLKNNVTLIDDTYNANPSSLFAGIQVLCELPGDSWLVLGDMGELGDDTQRIHFDVGLYARKSGVTRLLTVGESSHYAAEAFGDGAIQFSTKNEMVSFIQQNQSEALGILVKGSRFMKMEQVVELLIKGAI